MTSRFPIERIDAQILEIPTTRPHKRSFGSISGLSSATIGGPSWNKQSPEGILHAINAFLAPAMLNTRRPHFFRSHPKTI